MAWIVLIISGVMEAVWATALGRMDGLNKITPLIIFIAGLVLSMLGLGYAMRSIPTGTAYCIWTGIGAAITVIIGIVTKTEPVSVLKIVFLIGLVCCVIGLKVVSKG